MRLTFSGVSKTFFSLRGAVEAVRNVDLVVREEELFVLLGPSGCGKSTVLNLAAGLERPTAGEIRLGDRVVASREKGVFVPPRERNVAMVFQSYALYPHLSVFENIAFPLRVAGESRDALERAVVQAAGTLGISDLLRVRPAELSGGQRQRVAIARAIVRKPALFLLDEPLSNLDAGLRTSTRGELKRLQRELGVTTLYVTHDQAEAMTLGDRIALFKDGVVVQTGMPGELYERPETPFAATFIGQTPTNLVRASVLEEGGGLFLCIGNGRFPLPPGPSARVRSLGTSRILFAIRPEHLSVIPPPPEGAGAGTVVAAEYLGRDTILHVRVHGIVLAVLAGETAGREGDSIGLLLDMERAHYFPDRNGP